MALLGGIPFDVQATKDNHRRPFRHPTNCSVYQRFQRTAEIFVLIIDQTLGGDGLYVCSICHPMGRDMRIWKPDVKYSVTGFHTIP